MIWPSKTMTNALKLNLTITQLTTIWQFAIKTRKMLIQQSNGTSKPLKLTQGTVMLSIIWAIFIKIEIKMKMRSDAILKQQNTI